MSTETTATAGEQNDEQSQETKSEFEAITSQEDFDKAIQTRIARERAKFADYDDVKAKADKLTVIEDENKTEAQKQSDRLAEIERENAELKSGKLRADVAEAKSDPTKGIVIPASMLTGTTKEELEASADALIKFKGKQQAPRLHIPNEGNSPTNTSNPSDDFAEFLNTQLGQQSA
ncbi:hypothetical protein [Cryobacterium sp. Y62]|uniref:hypothetical protein n=1 Tax=Cryobacterium sp. Y62 TaxID=2048284 RepID=UPI000CE421D3|nr:hypothetical protein [Cryobacterium sp. Y62]